MLPIVLTICAIGFLFVPGLQPAAVVCGIGAIIGMRVDKERDDAYERAERYEELTAEGKLVEAQRLKSRTEYDLEMLDELDRIVAHPIALMSFASARRTSDT